MNDYELSSYKNVRVLVRIRNHPGEKDKLNETQPNQPNLRLDRSSKSPSNRETNTKEKPKSKSPTSQSKNLIN